MKNENVIKSVTNCPTCGCECKIGRDGETHYYIPQTNQPESPKLGEICIACNEPFRLYGTVLLCQCNNDSDSWKQVAHHVSEIQKIVRNEPIETEVDIQEFAIWMTGCGYDFTQHEYYMKNKHLLTTQPVKDEVREVAKNVILEWKGKGVNEKMRHYLSELEKALKQTK